MALKAFAKITAIWLYLTALGVNSAHALINGKPLEGHPDLVRLVFMDGTMCTGAYINETTILTAAHCLIKKDGEKLHRLEKILSVDDRALPVEHLQNVLHPKFDHSWWPSFDVGLIKTSKNVTFRGDLKVSTADLTRTGKAKFLGCGISEFTPKTRTRAFGENDYLRIGNVLFFIGASRNEVQNLGQNTSIAPNDSGGPVVSETGEIIAISTQATAAISARYRLPALSVATSITEPEIAKFIASESQSGGRFL